MERDSAELRGGRASRLEDLCEQRLQGEAESDLWALGRGGGGWCPPTVNPRGPGTPAGEQVSGGRGGGCVTPTSQPCRPWEPPQQNKGVPGESGHSNLPRTSAPTARYSGCPPCVWRVDLDPGAFTKPGARCSWPLEQGRDPPGPAGTGGGQASATPARGASAGPGPIRTVGEAAIIKN